MTPLSHNVSDADLITFIDNWASLMEAQNYDAAFAFTDHVAEMRWTPDLIRQVIQTYGDSNPDQKVTVTGKPTDITQRKEVTRWDSNSRRCIGEIWYDLNIEGLASDLTATFDVYQSSQGLNVQLNDIHVM